MTVRRDRRLPKGIVLTHIVSPMPEDEENKQPDKTKVARVTKAFSDYYLLEDGGSFSLINGAHVVRFEAKPEGGNWVLVIHLADGSHHTARTHWSAEFIEAVFGLSGVDQEPRSNSCGQQMSEDETQAVRARRSA
jgi:hypothetical protein